MRLGKLDSQDMPIRSVSAFFVQDIGDGDGRERVNGPSGDPQ